MFEETPSRSEFLHEMPLVRHGRDLLVAALISMLAGAIFWFCPVRQVTDSNYSMLVSQGLINTGSLALDQFNFPKNPPHVMDSYISNGDDYRVEQRNGRLYYFFPPGSPILSLPFVKLMNVFGISSVELDGSYNKKNEILIEGVLAAILMGVLTGIFFLSARLVLPLRWSLLVALATAFGTQIWSTASRALWSDTWGMLLLGAALFLLLGHAAARLRLHPILLATLLAWSYFCRPTYSVAVIGISLYIALYCRRNFAAYALTGAAWLACFVAYSWIHFSKLLPSYYLSKLRFTVFWESLAGNLFSPGRGLLVYSPILLFVLYLLVRFRKSIPFRPLAALAALVITAHLFVVGAFVHWWGGASYGPRLTASLVPWFFLLAVIGLRALIDWRMQNSDRISFRNWTLPLTVGALLLGFSLFAHGRGAISRDTFDWNDWVQKGEPHQNARIWAWRYPQFMAGLMAPPMTGVYPPVEPGTTIDFSKPESDAYAWYGWSEPEEDFRWSKGRESAIVFSVRQKVPFTMKVTAVPFLYESLLPAQHLTILLNDKEVGQLEMREPLLKPYVFTLPLELLKDQNVLRIKLPDATAPISITENNKDERALGILVKTITFEPLQPRQ
jgi:hypothetical protein